MKQIAHRYIGCYDQWRNLKHIRCICGADISGETVGEVENKWEEHECKPFLTLEILQRRIEDLSKDQEKMDKRLRALERKE